jgi:hypothetical protein
MSIADISTPVRAGAEDTGHGLQDRADCLEDRRLMRILGATSLFTGAMLLARGRRRAALTAATVGTVLVALEQPRTLINAWEALPSYLQTGERFLDRLEGFIDQIAAQERRLRGLADRLQRQQAP